MKGEFEYDIGSNKENRIDQWLGNRVQKELNIVSWNGREPKYDLRSWSPEGIALRGLTLTEDEAKELQKVLNDMFAE